MIVGSCDLRSQIVLNLLNLYLRISSVFHFGYLAEFIKLLSTILRMCDSFHHSLHHCAIFKRLIDGTVGSRYSHSHYQPVHLAIKHKLRLDNRETDNNTELSRKREFETINNSLTIYISVVIAVASL